MSTKKHLHIRALTEGAMLVAAAQVLSLVKLYEFPQGGSVTAAMFPILLYALRWGLGRGLLAGLALGLAISFLLEIIDTTIKPGDDLYKIYEIPVFAEIVDFESEGGAKKK